MQQSIKHSAVRKLFLACTCFVMLSCNPQRNESVESDASWDSLKLRPSPMNGKWAYIDETDKVIIEPRFDMAFLFGLDNLAVVKAGAKFGMINKKGDFVIQPEHDALRNFANGLAAAQNGSKWGYINLQGDFVIKPQFEAAYEFAENNLAPVAVESSKLESGWIFGYIDKRGSFVIKPAFKEASSFDGEEAYVTSLDGKALYINSSGSTIRIVESETSSVKDDVTQNILKFEGTFEEINAFEGSCSVTFADSEGNRFAFSNERSEVDMSTLGLYSTEAIEGTSIPNYILNEDAKGKKYTLTYRIEHSSDNDAGEEWAYYILVDAKMISN